MRDGQETKQQPISLDVVATDLNAITAHLEENGWQECPSPNCTLCRPATTAATARSN